MKMLLTALTIASFATVFSLRATGQVPPARALPQIAYLSPQRIMTESTAAKAEVTRLQTMQAQKTTELRAKQQTLEETRRQLALAANPERTALQEKEQKERTDLERATTEAQTELQTLQRQIQTGVATRLKAAIDDFVKGQNIALVLNADSGVVWAAPGVGLDLTDAIVQRLNAAPATAPKP